MRSRRRGTSSSTRSCSSPTASCARCPLASPPSSPATSTAGARSCRGPSSPRCPSGGGRFTKETEARILYGPPLPNPQVAAVRGGEVLVTTYDRDRVVGVLYRLVDGRAEMIAGGTPPSRLSTPMLKQPEGVAF